MSSFLIIIKISFISMVMASLIIFSVISYTIGEKEKNRVYIERKNISITKDISNSSVISKRDTTLNEDLKEFNSNINILDDHIMNQSEVDNLKDIKIFEINLLKNIKKHWISPFNYKNGSSCSIDLYLGRKKDIKYHIFDCEFGDAIFKRSVELSLIKNIDSDNILKSMVKKKITVNFMP
jgi:hypothetical protein